METAVKTKKKSAANYTLSPFAQFHMDSIGYRFTKRNGVELCKWEVFDKGYTNAQRIINGLTPIQAVKIDPTK
jgi:hypothetical protein